jgi:hypothetical protein
MRWQEAVRCCTAIPAAQRLVIAHIGATADPQGRNAWRCNDLVVDELGVSPETVKRARKAAVGHGLWVVSRAAPRFRGSRKTHEYRLMVPVSGVETTPFSGVSSDPTNDPTNDLVGSAETVSGVRSDPLVGSGECTPSVYSSGNSSGESARAREDDEPLDVPAVPDPGNALSPRDLHLQEIEMIDAELVDTNPDPEPPRGCDDHPNDDAGYTCRPCVGRAKAYKRWEGRQNGRFMAALAVYKAQQNAAREATKPAWRCDDCHDDGIVLNRDGKPGSRPRICHHDRSWHEATPEELAEHADLIKELNEGTAA